MRLAGLLRLVAHRFGVVAIRVASERAVIVGVIFGPQTWLVEERVDFSAGCRGERSVRFAEAFAGRVRAEPEVGLRRHSEADDIAEVHDPRPTERGAR
jgi:hypothetical protein